MPLKIMWRYSKGTGSGDLHQSSGDSEAGVGCMDKRQLGHPRRYLPRRGMTNAPDLDDQTQRANAWTPAAETAAIEGPGNGLSMHKEEMINCFAGSAEGSCESAVSLATSSTPVSASFGAKTIEVDKKHGNYVELISSLPPTSLEIMSFRNTIFWCLSALAVALPHDNSGNIITNGLGTSCLNGWSESKGNNGDDTTYCCPGQSIADSSPGGVYGCAIGSTTVPFSVAGYTSVVSSLAAEDSGGSMKSMATSSMMSSAAEETSLSGGNMETTSMGLMSSSGAGGGAQAAESSSTSSGNGAPMMTAAPLLGAAAFAMFAL
ncbi:hypothetical protein CERZMDRAFT_96503 [Cercospora zeae-maydis SCOH1-5]|uniref:Uncharacterized protein n=1 Tax=Cercospora zeae-maydis SCOH1-5 TaxID=717836 RepID=A0A6A6FJU6_9PEZI|nr:hypothetical protein CERZMDRAFT_96503 [Cercospora zeae-maydis SCOH1-5]